MKTRFAFCEVETKSISFMFHRLTHRSRFVNSYKEYCWFWKSNLPPVWGRRWDSRALTPTWRYVSRELLSSDNPTEDRNHIYSPLNHEQGANHDQQIRYSYFWGVYVFKYPPRIALWHWCKSLSTYISKRGAACFKTADIKGPRHL